MALTHAERRVAQREARNELQVLSAAHRDQLLKNKDAGGFEAPIKQARLALLELKGVLEAEGLELPPANPFGGP